MSQYKFKINGKSYEVAVNGIEDGIASVNVNGTNYKVELEDAPAATAGGGFAPEERATLGIVRGGTSQRSGEVGSSGSETSDGAKPATAANSAGAGAGSKVVSPLPGVIIEVCVGPGEVVKKGQRIAVIEAMKMENDILAETTGRIAEVFVKKGDSVLEGADIASIA